MTPVLSLQAIGKTFEPGKPVLQEVSLRIEPGAMVCLLGPSGCGKTTLLRLVAGFETPDAGAIHLGGQLVSRAGHVVAPEKRHIGMVFQDYALFPAPDGGPEHCIRPVSSSGRPPRPTACRAAATG